jgi:Uma2 family endonuclease
MITDLRPSFSRHTKPEGDPPRWRILSRPEVHLHARGQTHVVTPALVGWTRERMPVLPNGDYTSLTPDWICEILSPSTESFDRKAKARLYLDAGVPWQWLVSPRARTVEAYRREGAFWMQLGVWTDEDIVAIEPFQEFELDLGLWWDGLQKEEPKDT